MIWLLLLGFSYTLSGLIAGYVAIDYSVNSPELDMVDTTAIGFLCFVFGYISFFIVMFIVLVKHKQKTKLP